MIRLFMITNTFGNSKSLIKSGGGFFTSSTKGSENHNNTSWEASWSEKWHLESTVAAFRIRDQIPDSIPVIKYK
jgi:hypothetical protein